MLFGVASFIWPGLTLLVLVMLFGIYALVDGIFALIAAFSRDTERQRRGALLAEGAGALLSA